MGHRAARALEEADLIQGCRGQMEVFAGSLYGPCCDCMDAVQMESHEVMRRRYLVDAAWKIVQGWLEVLDGSVALSQAPGTFGPCPQTAQA